MTCAGFGVPIGWSTGISNSEPLSDREFAGASPIARFASGFVAGTFELRKSVHRSENESVPMKCDACGSDNAASVLQCRVCNRSLRAVALDTAADRVPPDRAGFAERRQVTALFCDLVDSVSLTVRLDPEDMMHVVDVYLSACDDIVARYGGTITQYMGDGVLAFFGYPRANEYDAANAVRAGLALRDAVERLVLLQGIRLQ